MSSFLITDVRIFDGHQVITQRGSVLVRDGLIAQVSTSPLDLKQADLSNVPIYSKPNHTLLPGLIDAHIHADFAGDGGLAQGLRFGVTTQCDLGNAPFLIEKLRGMLKEGGVGCSDLKAAMTAASPEGGWPGPLLKSIGVELPPAENKLQTGEDGRQLVRDQVSAGADYIKIIHESGKAFGMELPKLPAAVLEGIVEEAHTSGLTVVAHALTLADTLEILRAGVDGTAHTILDQPPSDELIEEFKARGAFCTPTLALAGSNTAEGREMQERYAHDPRVEGLLEEGGKERLCQCLKMTKTKDGSTKNAVETVRRLSQAGVDIVCGTDATTLAAGTAYGLSLHQELALLVNECGFSPLEALRTATSLPAKRYQFADRGRVQEGMRADLVLMEGDPTADISRTLDLRGAWVAGKLCSRFEDSL